jgi:hypothetical protein
MSSTLLGFFFVFIGMGVLVEDAAPPYVPVALTAVGLLLMMSPKEVKN